MNWYKIIFIILRGNALNKFSREKHEKYIMIVINLKLKMY